MNDQNNIPVDPPTASEPGPADDYKEYAGPTKTEETSKTNTETDSRFGTEILTILEGFGEEIKRLSKSVSEYIDKESFGKAAESVKEALSDAGEGIKRTTQNMGEKLEEERIQRAIKDLKDYAKRTGKSVLDLFKEEHPAPAADYEKKAAKAAEYVTESPEHESSDATENDINFDNTFGG